MKSVPATAVLVALLASAAPVSAGPSFGLGLSFIFGGSVAIGGRVFSTDSPQSSALSVGADYNFRNRSVRPSIGAAYLGNSVYTDFSIGVDMLTRNTDFSIGTGGLGGMK